MKKANLADILLNYMQSWTVYSLDVPVRWHCSGVRYVFVCTLYIESHGLSQRQLVINGH